MLAVILLLIICATFLSYKAIGIHLQDKANAELASVAGLEVKHIEEALEAYRAQALQLVASVDFGEKDRFLPSEIGNNTSVAVPLEQLQEKILEHSRAVSGNVKALSVLSGRFDVLSTSDNATTLKFSNSLIAKAIVKNSAVYGPAFKIGEEDRRIFLIAPVTRSDRYAVRAVVFEMDLDPVFSSVVQQLKLGESREVHVVQQTPYGEPQYITPFRFMKNASFQSTALEGAELPANRSIESTEPESFKSIDYRGEWTVFALDKIKSTGWGLVAKIDDTEANALTKRLQFIAIGFGAIGLFLTVAAWIMFLKPIGQRLKSISRAADRIAAGDYRSPIQDVREDEIGNIAKSVDTLATALDEDIAKRSIVEDKLLYSATHDELTQLYNRKFAQQQIAELVANGVADIHSVLFLDLDGFKAINDTYGHRAGDEILIAISQRLKRALDTDTTLARWGGDEFVIILPNMHRTYAEKVADRVKKLFVEKFKTSIGFHSLGVSIGIACSGEKLTLEAALQEADAKMYKEKQQRRLNGSKETTSILGAALEEDRVEVWYQPILSLTDHDELTLCGAEVLARIRNPDGSIATPGEFLFETEGPLYGKALDERVVEIALNTLAQWRSKQKFEHDFQLSLNLSEHAINDETFTDEFAKRIKKYDVPKRQLAIEIAQNTSYIDQGQLEKLRANDVIIALDDIGVHHSNLSRLAEIEPEIAKIDKSWLNEAGTLKPETAEVILKNLIAMCSELGSTVVVEGIESKEQVMRLASLGVKHYQGYHLGKPLPEESFVREWNSSKVASLAYKKAG